MRRLMQHGSNTPRLARPLEGPGGVSGDGGGNGPRGGCSHAGGWHETLTERGVGGLHRQAQRHSGGGDRGKQDGSRMGRELGTASTRCEAEENPLLPQPGQIPASVPPSWIDTRSGAASFHADVFQSPERERGGGTGPAPQYRYR